MIGYWESSEEKNVYPHPRDLADATWEPGFKVRIVDYLRSGIRFRGSWGYSQCRFNDGRPDEEMGSMELTDGVYAWPEGLAVYVEKYNVILPEDFVAHIKQINFKVPTSLSDDRIKVDYSYWKHWVGQYLK
jgi:hypothetical protein